MRSNGPWETDQLKPRRIAQMANLRYNAMTIPSPTLPSLTESSTDDFIAAIIKAHGGADRWSKVHSIEVTFQFSGALLDLKGYPGHHTPTVHIDTQTPKAIIQRLGGNPDDRWIYTPERCWIERKDGKVLQMLDSPRDSFKGMTRSSPLSDLQLTYFLGYAMWNYLIAPFFLIRPGFSVNELGTHTEYDEVWRVLEITWPDDIPAHHRTQKYYFDTETFMLRRFDYVADVFQAHASHYCFDPKTFAGIVVPTMRRVVRRDPETGRVFFHGPTSFLLDYTDVIVRED